MDDLIKMLDLIEERNDIINMFNIFMKFEKKVYLTIFKEFIEKIKFVRTFDDCGIYLNKYYIKYKHIITYIKCYNVLNDFNTDYIIFNDTLYKDIQENEKLDSVYKNDDGTLIFKIEERSENTTKLIKYLLTTDNFINSFITKRNKRTTLLTVLWKNEILKNSNKIDLTKLNYKKNFDTKIYKETNKKYKIQKHRKIEFLIKKEVLITSIRLSLPNSFTISLIDNTYICMNKIIISEKLFIGNYKFKNIREKIIFIFKLYEKFFNIDINLYDFVYNVSIKIKNIERIMYLNIIQSLQTDKISFTDNYIIVKYINSYKNLIETYKKINEYKKKYKKYFKYFDNIDSSILYLTDEDIDKFFSSK